jgi:hypothetical protein
MISKAKLKDKVIIIELPLQEPKVSASGKGIVVATTRGPFNTGVEYKGSDLFIVANAYVKNPTYNGPDGVRRKKSKQVSRHES